MLTLSNGLRAVTVLTGTRMATNIPTFLIHLLMANLQLTVEQINALQTTEVVHNEAVKERFIYLYNTLWKEGGEAAYERESRYFDIILGENEALRTRVKPFSVFTSFIDLAVCGLSVEPGVRALAYLIGRNSVIGKGQDGKNIYEGRCVLTISGYGELVLRARSGQIKHADNPVLVYQEDSFSFTDNDGRKSVHYTCSLPHTSGHVVAAFMKITRNDDSIDYAVMFEEDWLRLADFSANQNKKWDNESRTYVKVPNALYTSGVNGGIDTGFLVAKVIKHAFKTYPKVRIGRSTELQSQQEPPQPDEPDFYGVAGQQPAPAMPPQPETFGPAPEQSAGVTIQPPVDDGAF